MIYCAESNIGCRRVLNEDSYCCGLTNGGKCFYFALSDGMGGHNGGEVASGIATEIFGERLPFAEKTENKTLEKCLTEAVEKANRRILLAADRTDRLTGMGATVALGIVSEDNVLTCANAGDCRIYVLSEGKMVKITRDHTYVATLVESGIIDQKEAENHPNKNMVTKALGTEEVVEPDIFTTQLKKSDKILICSDGLYDMISEYDIKNELENENESFDTVCNRLVRLANAAGGNDNITVIAAEVI